MEFVRTLKQVQISEAQTFGVRACDLSLLASQRVVVPTSFVLTTKAWDVFVKKNNIQYKIDFILKQIDMSNQRTINSAYNSIRKLILHNPLPDEVLAEIKEAYESLGSDFALDEMMKEDNAPYVLMFSSPTYPCEAESFEGVVQNVRGMEQIILALKEIYAMNFTANALLYRHRIGQKDFDCGVVFQSMPKAVASATAYSTDPEHQGLVFVHTYKGFTDLRDVVAKDFFHVKKEFLNVAGSQIVEQSKIITRNEEGHLTPEEFAGREQTINDKEVMEVGRLAKKSEKALGSPVKLFLAIDENNEFFVLFANRYAVRQKGDRVAKQPGVQEERPTHKFKQDASTGEVVMKGAVSANTQQKEPVVEDPQNVIVEEHDKYDSEDDDIEDVQEYYTEDSQQEDSIQEKSFEIEEGQTTKEPVVEDDLLGAADDEEFEEEAQEFVEEPEEDESFLDEYEEDTVQGVEDDQENTTVENDTIQEEVEPAQATKEETPNEQDSENLDDQEGGTEVDSYEYEEDSKNEQTTKEPVVEDDLLGAADDEEFEEEAQEFVEEPEEDKSFIEEDETTPEDSFEYEEEQSGQEVFKEDKQEGDAFVEDDTTSQDDEGQKEQHTQGVTPVSQEEAGDVVEDQENVRDMLNKSFRIIYAELSKEYEKGGEQAPDTITELVQKGVQKQLFHIDGLSDILAVKRKLRTDDPITEDEKALVLGVLNELVE